MPCGHTCCPTYGPCVEQQAKPKPTASEVYIAASHLIAGGTVADERDEKLLSNLWRLLTGGFGVLTHARQQAAVSEIAAYREEMLRAEVERLRAANAETCQVAEDRIGALEAEVERLRLALSSVACLAGEGPDAYAVTGRSGLVQDIASVALEALR